MPRRATLSSATSDVTPGSRSIYQIGQEVNPVTLEKLDRIVQVWADACLQLRDRDVRVMQRLVAAQDRLQGLALAAE